MGQKSIPTVAIGKPVEGQPGTFANERIVNESDFEGIYKAKGYEIVDLPDRAPGVRSPGRNADSGIKPAAPASTEGATGSGNALGDTSTPESATGDSGDEFDALKGDIPDPVHPTR